MNDLTLQDLLPHRAPMLLLHRMLDVSAKAAEAEVLISPQVPFYIEGKGVPSWIGVEYMGQTAALIAGYQLRRGITRPHLGLLLGTRKFSAVDPWFLAGSRLHIRCSEEAVVGDGLAMFLCEIRNLVDARLVASAKLSVFRKPID